MTRGGIDLAAYPDRAGGRAWAGTRVARPARTSVQAFCGGSGWSFPDARRQDP